MLVGIILIHFGVNPLRALTHLRFVRLTRVVVTLVFQANLKLLLSMPVSTVR